MMASAQTVCLSYRGRQAVVSYGTSHVQIRSPPVILILNRAVTGAGAVATEAEAKKKQKYCGLSATYCFIPVAVESRPTGALGQDATDFLHELGGRIAAATGDPRTSEYLFQRLMLLFSAAMQHAFWALVLTAAVKISFCLIICYIKKRIIKV